MSIWQPSLTFGSNGKKREMHLKTAVSRRTTKKLKNERKSAASRDNRWWRAMSSEIKRRKKGRVAGLVHPQRKTNKTRGNRTKSSEQPATQAAATTATACVLMRPWWSSSISEPGRSIFLHRPTSFFFCALLYRFDLKNGCGRFHYPKLPLGHTTLLLISAYFLARPISEDQRWVICMSFSLSTVAVYFFILFFFF